MSLYAIGDLHLHFQSELKAPGQIHGKIWKNHETVFMQNCRRMMNEDDSLILLGDHSWGKSINECRADLDYICSLPGRKILLRGNHDQFWEPNKTSSLNREYEGRLFFLQNNFASYGEYALVGTKGYIFEGPYFLDPTTGKVIGWDAAARDHADKLIRRELQRLQSSFDAAIAAGFRKFIMLLHYPPTEIMDSESPYTQLAEKYGVEKVIYAHCHGENRFNDSLKGLYNGTEYMLASGDYLKWQPVRVLP